MINWVESKSEFPDFQWIRLFHALAQTLNIVPVLVNSASLKTHNAGPWEDHKSKGQLFEFTSDRNSNYLAAILVTTSYGSVFTWSRNKITPHVIANISATRWKQASLPVCTNVSREVGHSLLVHQIRYTLAHTNVWNKAPTIRILRVIYFD